MYICKSSIGIKYIFLTPTAIRNIFPFATPFFVELLRSFPMPYDILLHSLVYLFLMRECLFLIG